MSSDPKKKAPKAIPLPVRPLRTPPFDRNPENEEIPEDEFLEGEEELTPEELEQLERRVRRSS